MQELIWLLLAESMLHAIAYMVITCVEYASCKSLYGYYLRRVCFMQELIWLLLA